MISAGSVRRRRLSSLIASFQFHKTRVISKTIQTPQNPKRLSNWALNISSRAFYIGFIFDVDRFIRFIHPRRRNLGCAYDKHQNRKYLKKGRVLLAELPAIRSCVRCKRGFRGACTSAVESLNYTAGGSPRDLGPYIFYSRLDNDATNKGLTIVSLSSFVLILSLRFTPQWDEVVASECQWCDNV